jgi:hypothetical protein
MFYTISEWYKVNDSYYHTGYAPIYENEQVIAVKAVRGDVNRPGKQ